MGWAETFLFSALLVSAAAIHGTHGDAIVTGTVFCDQCKDGHISLFDYPLYGIKVSMACPRNDGQLTMWREETTNWLGNYAMRLEGSPDLSGCYAQVSGGRQGSAGCGSAAGPAQSLKFVFRMFDMAMYSVDTLLSQPAEPMSFCSRSASPVPAPVTRPPPFLPPPAPPLPRLPPVPFLEASACSYEQWMMPEYRCYWKVVNPDSKVAVVFGLMAAERYGRDLTLWEGMKGRGEPYKTLLREGTTSLLNSYNSLQFPYNSLQVFQNMNWALMSGSTRRILVTALRFRRANSGSGNHNFTCKFTPCK